MWKRPSVVSNIPGRKILTCIEHNGNELAPHPEEVMSNQMTFSTYKNLRRKGAICQDRERSNE